MPPKFAAAALAAVLLAQGIITESAHSQAPAQMPAAAWQPSYADLADLADRATLVARVEPREIAQLKPEASPGLQPGRARIFVKARTRAVLVGEPQGESVSYLADVALDSKGKLPKFKKLPMLIFARPVAGRPGELQLVAPHAQLAWSDPVEQRLRAVLTELVAPGAPPRIAGVREASHVPGNLIGEGETQIFLATRTGDTVSISVIRRPGQDRYWGVSFGEIVDQAARPPVRDTLAWYRLACFLPAALPPGAALGGNARERAAAAEDFRFVRSQLGACPRTWPLAG